MADRYWVGGVSNYNATGAWSTTKGGAGGASTPGINDVAYIGDAPATYWASSTALSLGAYRCPTSPNGYAYVVTSAGTSGTTEPTWPTSVGNTVTDGTVVWTCRSPVLTISAAGNFLGLDFTGFIGTFAGNQLLSTASGSGAAVNLTFSSAMVITFSLRLGLNSGGIVTVSAANKVIPFEMRFQNGSTLKLNSDLTYTNTFASSSPNSSVNFNGYNLTCTNWNFPSSINILSMNSASTLTVTGTSFNGLNKTYSNVVLSGAGTVAVSGTNNFENLTRTGTAVFTDGITFSGDQTITGTLTLTGNSATNRLYVGSNTRGTSRTLTAAAVSITNCDFEVITGAGAASPFTGTSVGDCWGNSGITFTPAVNRYWIGGAGNWSNAAEWSDTSGGSGGFSVPLPQDTGYFTAASLVNNATVTLDMPRYGNIVNDGETALITLNVPVNSATISIYGSKHTIFGTQMATSGTNITVNYFGRGTHYISGSNWTNLRVDAITGTYTASGVCSTAGTNTTSSFTLASGTFDADVYDMNFGAVVISGTSTRTLSMGSGTWTTLNTGTTIWNASNTTNLTFNKGTAVININATISPTSVRTFSGGGLSYGTVTLDGATAVTFAGSNTFDSISDVSLRTRTVRFTSGTTNTFTNWSLSGGAANTLTLGASTTSQAVLVKAGGGVVSINYANISYINGSPIDTWYALTSIDGGNNTNVYFTIPTTSPSSGLFFGSNF